MRRKHYDYYLPSYPPKLEKYWLKVNNRHKDACLLCLPGRMGHARELVEIYKKLKINATIVGITPKGRAWYPMPNGADDQKHAVAGVVPAVKVVENAIRKIESWGFTRNKIALTGHSAGAVMAIMTAARSSKPFAGVISHCGAILDPDKLPAKRNNTPYLLTHGMDDQSFSWEERFLPMLAAMKSKDYNVCASVEPDAGHGVSAKQFGISRRFLFKCFESPSQSAVS